MHCRRAPGGAALRAAEETTKCKMLRLICWSGGNASFQIMLSFRAACSVMVYRGPHGNFLEVCPLMQTLTKHFCRALLSSEQPTALGQLGHLHCWETGKPDARGPWDSERTVRNYRISHEKTRDVSARSRWNILTVRIWVVCCFGSCV